ncbi:uncharacterized protein N7446_010747 [Penicillium canescens]|uniref:beta-glucosidase n=1 Tax=Penicillium canescens TaxID=5083 RepID=A0AAD6IB49_PENCN|nr:uncharacterized protein N7446_010747 [Penicillium canescens]KAJ6041364.1 hypothetical protein N7460_006754 [Penicillium canescens]KAJ6050638.1 hypothetical protein N7446_010747 [Penicillium canescens]KAJ6065862.1 hypothetical protein N7444_001515 [Penicillium canescens]
MLGRVILAAALMLNPTGGLATPAPDLVGLEKLWSYGHSEPVYPTSETRGLGNWTNAYAQAKKLVAQMTAEEKSNVTYGYASTSNGCSGNSGSVPRLGYPGICLQDAGNGVRGTDMVNSYASGIHVGASWNQQLAYDRAKEMGREFKRKGVNVALGPVVGPLGRIARGGRNWEGFGNDPYLSGVLAGVTVRGLQESVIACVKHFIANEQETSRNPPLLTPGALNQSVSSNVDDKTLHELYLWPFQDAVKAGVGSVMCSYNRINNSYGCQNSKTINGLLKGELGFQGFVVSDWYAQHSGISSAAAGLDLAMPDSPYWAKGSLAAGVRNGSLSSSRLDDMAKRILAAWYNYAELDHPGSGMPVSLLEPHELIDARDPASEKTRGALPLRKPKFVSLFGYDAVAAPRHMPDQLPFSLWSMGLDNSLVYPNGSAIDDAALMSIFTSSRQPSDYGPGVALNGTLFSGGGSGSNTPSYIDAPFDAFQRQARRDGTFLAWDFVSAAPRVNPASDTCVVFVNEQSSEGWDRPSLADAYSDRLVENVADQCANTMVVIHNAGVRLVDRWVDHANISAVIYAHLPGQDTGGALTEVMYGRQSPSGRLPYTVAKTETDYGSLLDPTVPVGDSNAYYPQDNFSEGVLIDYRAFEATGISPRFEFGYGLTYTTFKYFDLRITAQKAPSREYLAPGISIDEGGLSSLWDVVVAVKFTVENTGAVAAAEVPQLYVGIPGGPAKVLRGFTKQLVQPGKRAAIVFELTRRDLSVWDVEAQNWGLQPGPYALYVGKSVRDIQLTGTLAL